VGTASWDVSCIYRTLAPTVVLASGLQGLPVASCSRVRTVRFHRLQTSGRDGSGQLQKPPFSMRPLSSLEVFKVRIFN